MSDSDRPEMYEPPDPLMRGQRHEVSEALEKKRVDELISLCATYQETFSTEAGKRVLADLQNRYDYHRSTHLEPGFPYEMTFREGRRSVVCDIHAAMSPQDPHRLREQMTQHRDRDPFDVLQPRRTEP